MTDTKVKFEDNKSPEKNIASTSYRKKKKKKERFNNRKKKSTYSRRKKTSTFKGSIDGMNGHMYEMFIEGASTVQFT